MYVQFVSVPVCTESVSAVASDGAGADPDVLGQQNVRSAQTEPNGLETQETPSRGLSQSPPHAHAAAASMVIRILPSE